MSKPNRALSPFIFLLVFTPVFSSGSPVHERSFKRPDPLRHFKYYTQGYDVRNKHYWASAAFTGVHGYAIAGVWILCGLGFGIFVTLKNLTSSSSPITDHLDRHYHIIFLLVLLFTVLAIVATSCALAANEKSLQKTKRLKNTILKAGEDARKSIRRVIKAIRIMQYILLPYDQKKAMSLNVTTHRLGKESRTIHSFIQNNSRSIDRAIQTSYKSHLMVVAVNLVLVVAALVLLLLHWHPGLIIIIFFCWILTSLCWVLTGFDFFLHTFAEDTCYALEDFGRNPQNNSLSSILPCMDLAYSDKILAEVGQQVHNFISQLNSKITEVYGMLGLNEQNDNLLGLSKICDPFSGAPNYSYVPQNCPKNAVLVGDLPNVLSKFTCYNHDSWETCKSSGKFLPEASYNMAWAYSQSVQEMINIYPDLQSLTQCTIVKDTFSDIVVNQCTPFRVSIRLLWSSMLALSVLMVVLVLIWVAKAYQDMGRSFSRWSIVPNSR